MERKYLTLQTVESASMIELSSQSKTLINELLANFKYAEELQKQEITLKKIGNKAAIFENMSYFYNKVNNITIIKSYYGSSSACILGFKQGSELDGTYIGYYVKSYLTDGKENEYIPLALELTNDQFVENIKIPTSESIQKLVKIMDDYLVYIIALDLLKDTSVSKIEIPYNEVKVCNKQLMENGCLVIKPDIEYLIKLAYMYKMFAEHDYYIKKSTIEYYAKEITNCNTIQYELINNFISVAANNAKKYNIF